LASPLEDLDELTLRCRDQKAREYIKEAIASYRVGAFRSAIVGTWIAVCFDLIEKIRELALAGDKEAEKQALEIDATRRTGDLTRALKFERELLTLAKEKFELISPLEYIDLERLQADRNRCAHPSLTADEQAYTPSAELARLHIHSAITHLLQHPPVQGKFALDRLCSEIDSEYFPTSISGAKVAFQSGPLRRPRESLVRNLIVILVKRMLKDKLQWKKQLQISTALQAIQKLHPEQYSKTFSSTLSTVFRTVLDDDLEVQIDFLKSISDSWQFLDEDVRQRMQNYVVDLPVRQIEGISFLLGFEPLQVSARKRLKKMTKVDFDKSIFFDFHEELGDWMVSKYLQSSSFDDANEWAKHIISYASDLTIKNIRTILSGAGSNSQITGSFQLSTLIDTLRSKNQMPEDEFDGMLTSNNLLIHLL